jgi:hypothetical protein
MAAALFEPSMGPPFAGFNSGPVSSFGAQHTAHQTNTLCHSQNGISGSISGNTGAPMASAPSFRYSDETARALPHAPRPQHPQHLRFKPAPDAIPGRYPSPPPSACCEDLPRFVPSPVERVENPFPGHRPNFSSASSSGSDEEQQASAAVGMNPNVRGRLQARSRGDSVSSTMSTASVDSKGSQKSVRFFEIVEVCLFFDCFVFSGSSTDSAWYSSGRLLLRFFSRRSFSFLLQVRYTYPPTSYDRTSLPMSDLSRDDIVEFIRYRNEMRRSTPQSPPTTPPSDSFQTTPLRKAGGQHSAYPSPPVSPCGPGTFFPSLEVPHEYRWGGCASGLQ